MIYSENIRLLLSCSTEAEAIQTRNLANAIDSFFHVFFFFFFVREWERRPRKDESINRK